MTGTRCTRCTPPSNFSRANGAVPGSGTPCALTANVVLDPAEVGIGRLDHLGSPAAGLGVSLVHPEEVTGEQGGFVSTLAGLDLQDDVGVVQRIARHEQLGEPLGGLLAGSAEILCLGRERRIDLGEFRAASKSSPSLSQVR